MQHSPARMHPLAQPLAAFGILLLAACSSQVRVDVDFDPAKGLGQVSSYAFASPAFTVADPNNPRLTNTLLHDRIRMALEDGLATRHLLAIPSPTQADLQVSWHLAREVRYESGSSASVVQTRPWNDPNHVGPYVVDQPELWRYEVEVLTLRFMDPKGQTQWQATAWSRPSEHETPAGRSQRVRKLVDAMLDHLPK